MKPVRIAVVLGLSLCLCSAAFAADEDKDKTIADLKAKVDSLDRRVAELEQLVGPLKAELRQRTLREKFDQRMAKDQAKYKPDQLREAEQLYQTMNKQWRTDAGKQALEQLVQKYPDLDRTGCAYLYLGQVSGGDDRVKYLQTAIDQYGDCLYGDGVQVGAFARLLLANELKQKGDAAGAKKLLDELRNDYPDAIDHSGNLLSEQLPKD